MHFCFPSWLYWQCNGYWFLSRLIFFSMKIPSLSFYLSRSKFNYCNPHLRNVCFSWMGATLHSIFIGTFHLELITSNESYDIMGEDLIWYKRNIKRGNVLCIIIRCMKTCRGLPLSKNDLWQLKRSTAAMNGLCLFYKKDDRHN